MQLSDREIHACLDVGKLIIVGSRQELPFDPVKQVQPASIDLRLDSRIIIFNPNIESFDVRNLENVWDYMSARNLEKGEGIIIPPNGIVFCQIYEQLRIPNDASARVVGRSRVARLGISVHCTGEYINPGFEGAMPLQLVNHNSFKVTLYPYMSICQLVLFKLTSVPMISYADRSNNPYNRERYASPSVCHSDDILRERLEISIQDEVEKRLVANYLKQLRKDNLMSEMREKANNDPKVTQQFSGTFYGVAGNVEGNQYVNGQSKDLAEAASEIQQLLKQLEATNPTATEEEQKNFVNLAIPPTHRERFLGALQSGGEAALEELPYGKVVTAIIEGWRKPQ